MDNSRYGTRDYSGGQPMPQQQHMPNKMRVGGGGLPQQFAYQNNSNVSAMDSNSPYQQHSHQHHHHQQPPSHLYPSAHQPSSWEQEPSFHHQPRNIPPPHQHHQLNNYQPKVDHGYYTTNSPQPEYFGNKYPDVNSNRPPYVTTGGMHNHSVVDPAVYMPYNGHTPSQQMLSQQQPPPSTNNIARIQQYRMGVSIPSHQQQNPSVMMNSRNHNNHSIPVSSSRDSYMSSSGGSNAQGRAINKMLLEIVRERSIDPPRLHLVIETFVDRMDCVNLATLLFHTGKKRFLLSPSHVKKIADRFNILKEELRSREASNALYGMKCLSSEVPEVRELIYAIGNKIAASSSDFVAQAVGNALYGCQMMSSEYEEVRFLLLVLSNKVTQCTELLEAQNVGNALYGMRGMSSDHREVRAIISALAPKIAKAKEELNGQALGNSLYGLQSMSSKEPEVRNLLAILATKAARTWEELKAQEVGNALYGLKRMSTDCPEVRILLAALVPKIASSPDLLDAQAIGNSFYGLQNMKSDNPEVLSLLGVLAEKVAISNPELDGQAMGNSLYGLQGMSSEFPEVRAVITALTQKIHTSCLEMNAQELGNALYGLQNMISYHPEVRRLMVALAHKVSSSRHELTSQEIGNALFGLQGMSSEYTETRLLIIQIADKIHQSHSVLDPQGVSNSLFGLQRLSSESKEVLNLIHALSFKVEQCWKLLGSHHLAHACFGLQGLSSESPEVRFMVKGLVQKIVNCREEMTAKQLSNALFGLQNFTSNHVEILGLITALTEKISLSGDVWNWQQISMAFYGIQGMNSDVEEVTLLLNVLHHKVSFAPISDIDANCLGNMVFGFQRMKSTNVEVSKIFNLILPAVLHFSHGEHLSALACANMLFGIQSFSFDNEYSRKIFEALFSRSQSIFEKMLSGMNRTTEMHIEVNNLYQALSIVSSQLVDQVLHQSLAQHVSLVLKAVEQMFMQQTDMLPLRDLTIAENNAFNELRSSLPRDAFNVRSPCYFRGFEVGILIQPMNKPSAPTNSASCANLIIEICGSSFQHPSKERYSQLRNAYLEREKNVSVKCISAELFASVASSGLSKCSNLLASLFPSSIEEAHLLTNSNNTSMSSLSGYLQPASFGQVADYQDDELITIMQVNAMIKGESSKRIFGMPFHWLGDYPIVNSLVHSYNNSLLTQQQFPKTARGNEKVSPTAVVAAEMKLKQQQQQQSAHSLSGNSSLTDRGLVPQAFSDNASNYSDFSNNKRLSRSSESTLMEASHSSSFQLHPSLSDGNDFYDNSMDNGTNSLKSSMSSSFRNKFEDPRSGIILKSSSSESSFHGLLGTNGFNNGPTSSFKINSSTLNDIHHQTFRNSSSSTDFQSSTDNLLFKSESIISTDLNSLALLVEKEGMRNTSNKPSPNSFFGNMDDNSSGAMSPLSGSHSRSTDFETQDEDEDDDDDEIAHPIEDEDLALLEAQLEIAKLEAKIKNLKIKKNQKVVVGRNNEELF